MSFLSPFWTLIALFLPSSLSVLHCDCTFSVRISKLGIAQKARTFLPFLFFSICTQLPCWVAKPQIQTLSRARCHGGLLCCAGGRRRTGPPQNGQTKGRFGCFPKASKTTWWTGKTSGRLSQRIPGRCHFHGGRAAGQLTRCHRAELRLRRLG